jgi:hypothetical protein
MQIVRRLQGNSKEIARYFPGAPGCWLIVETIEISVMMQFEKAHPSGAKARLIL